MTILIMILILPPILIITLVILMMIPGRPDPRRGPHRDPPLAAHPLDRHGRQLTVTVTEYCHILLPCLLVCIYIYMLLLSILLVGFLL